MKKILFILVLPFFVCGFSKQEVLREKFTACIDSIETKSVEEVRQIGLELGLPYELVYKTPSDGLCGKSDEDNLGFTYEVLDKYIRTGYCKNKELQKKIDNRHINNKFKLEPMQSYQYGEINAKVK